MGDEKRFTQADMDRAIASKRREWEGERQKLETDHATVVEAARARVTDLEGQITTVTKERDGLSTKLEGAAATQAKIQGDYEASKVRARSFRTELDITRALSMAKGLPLLQSASKHALKAFLDESELEHDDDGAVAAVTYRGSRYEQAGAAAEVFLREHNYFVAASNIGGGGSRAPNSSSYVAPKADITNTRPEDLIEQGWKEGQRP